MSVHIGSMRSTDKNHEKCRGMILRVVSKEKVNEIKLFYFFLSNCCGFRDKSRLV